MSTRVVHGLGQMRFGVESHLTRLNQVSGIWTCDRPKVRVRLDGTGHQLNGSKPLGDFGSESQQDTNQNPKQIAREKKKIKTHKKEDRETKNPNNNKEIKIQITQTKSKTVDP